MRNAHRVLLAAAFAAVSSVAAHGQIYTDTFNSSATAGNYNVFQTTGAAGANTSTAVFGFDYSSLGIPAARTNGLTDTGTGQTALRVQSDDTTATTSDLIGAISVVTKNLTLPSAYSVSVEVWSNYVGDSTGIPGTGGSNSSTGATIAVGNKGTTYESATSNAAQGGAVFDAVRDATSGGGTYRVYINGVNEGNNAGSPPVFPSNFYTAGTDSTAAQFNTADDGNFYKTLFPSVTAPTVQSSAASTQQNATPAGVFGFAWHNETITQTGTSITWAIDGTTIATVPDSAITLMASNPQVALGDQDSNTGTGPTTYNFDLFENLVVTALPEPASTSLLGLGALGLLARRRK